MRLLTVWPIIVWTCSILLVNPERIPTAQNAAKAFLSGVAESDDDISLRRCSVAVDRHRVALAECTVVREPPGRVTCNCHCPTCIPDGFPDVATLPLCTTPPPVPMTMTMAPAATTAAPTLPPPPPLAPLPVLPPLAQKHLPTLGPMPPTVLPTTQPPPPVMPGPAPAPAVALLAYEGVRHASAATGAALEHCRAAERSHQAEVARRGCDKGTRLRLRRVIPSNCNCQCAPCDSWAPPPATWASCRPPPTAGPADMAAAPKPTTPAPPTNPPPSLPPTGAEYLPTLKPGR